MRDARQKKHAADSATDSTDGLNASGDDRGVDGWYRAAEVDAETADVLRVGGYLYVARTRYRVVGVSRRIPPKKEGGVVVRCVVAEVARPTRAK